MLLQRIVSNSQSYQIDTVLTKLKRLKRYDSTYLLATLKYEELLAKVTGISYHYLKRYSNCTPSIAIICGLNISIYAATLFLYHLIVRQLLSYPQPVYQYIDFYGSKLRNFVKERRHGILLLKYVNLLNIVKTKIRLKNKFYLKTIDLKRAKKDYFS